MIRSRKEAKKSQFFLGKEEVVSSNLIVGSRIRKASQMGGLFLFNTLIYNQLQLFITTVNLY